MGAWPTKTRRSRRSVNGSATRRSVGAKRRKTSGPISRIGFGVPSPPWSWETGASGPAAKGYGGTRWRTDARPLGTGRVRGSGASV